MWRRSLDADADASSGRTRSNRAFSLIELLLVIAIVTLLAAILFPVYSTALEKARQTTCASNLKQIVLGTSQYVQDYDEVYPVCDEVAGPILGTNPGNPIPSTDFVAMVSDELDPYIKSTCVWLCPDEPVMDSQRLLRSAGGRRWDYGYHGNLFGFDCTNSNIVGFPLQVFTTQTSQIVAPSTQIMYADFMYSQCFYGGGSQVHNDEYGGIFPTPDTWYEGGAGYPASIPLLGFPSNVMGPHRQWPTYADWNFSYMAPRHTNYSANCAYADGHVKMRSVEAVFAHGCGDPLSEFCNSN